MNIQILDKARFRYRIGDIVLNGNNALNMVLDLDSPFHNTIGYDYATMTFEHNRFLDFELLRKIVRDHTQKHQYAVPPVDELVVHYRAGDSRRVNAHEILALSNHAKNACAESRLTRIQIVTAFHYENKHGADEVNQLNKENFESLERLLLHIEEMGIAVSVKSNGGIDEDFCYLSNAEHLLPTRGGYSILAALCNPNRIYPTFPNTMEAIRHYAKSKPVSFRTEDLILFLKQNYVKTKPNDIEKFPNKPVLQLLRKTKFWKI